MRPLEGIKVVEVAQNLAGPICAEILAALGAERIGERYQHDASSGTLAEEVALEWVQDWASLAREKMSAAV